MALCRFLRLSHRLPDADLAKAWDRTNENAPLRFRKEVGSCPVRKGG